ncbi:MAG: hypothetical protein OXE53_18380 [Deltaproteobacteria bacterium]|nr:hypothetical protein [Deltaproteobacteria bacterium]
MPGSVRIDRFIADSQAPALGLYLTRTANGIAYDVCRAETGERVFCGNRFQVSLWLRGYAANVATMPPRPLVEAIEHLDGVLDDDAAGNGKVLDAAIEVARVYRDDVVHAPPSWRCARCGTAGVELIDNGWLCGAMCGGCAEHGMKTIEADLRAIRSHQGAAS